MKFVLLSFLVVGVASAQSFSDIQIGELPQGPSLTGPSFDQTPQQPQIQPQEQVPFDLHLTPQQIRDLGDQNIQEFVAAEAREFCASEGISDQKCADLIRTRCENVNIVVVNPDVKIVYQDIYKQIDLHLNRNTHTINQVQTIQRPHYGLNITYSDTATSETRVLPTQVANPSFSANVSKTAPKRCTNCDPVAPVAPAVCAPHVRPQVQHNTTCNSFAGFWVYTYKRHRNGIRREVFVKTDNLRFLEREINRSRLDAQLIDDIGKGPRNRGAKVTRIVGPDSAYLYNLLSRARGR